MAKSNLLEAKSISKAFPGVQALQDVSLRLHPGEILAVVGENGAGKSTLMKILAGVEHPDSGELRFKGHPVRFADVMEAQNQGIALIHQELCLATNLDIAANIFLGREPRRTFLGLVRSSIYREAEDYCRRLGIKASVRSLVADLSIGQQQLVEIARALSLRSQVLIMDEPTSSLTQRETERLFEVMNDLKAEGIGIIYISHLLKEVEQLADRVVVLRDGRNAGNLSSDEIDHEAMVRLMVGRDIKQFFSRTHRDQEDSDRDSAEEQRRARSSDPSLSPEETGIQSARNLSSSGIAQEQDAARKPTLASGQHRSIQKPLLVVQDLVLDIGSRKPFSFELRAGEIVGVAGLMGSGRTELAEALFGVTPGLRGFIYLNGNLVHLRSVVEAMRQGIFLLPEDRRLEGLVLESSVKDNLTLAVLKQLTWNGLIQQRAEQNRARELCQNLNIRTPGIHQTVGLLSGGNQQKVVLGKGLTRKPRLFILDEPTRGVDVGAKREIYGIMDEMAGEGVAILMISSDLEEIIGLSDRALVMHQGALAGELPREELSEEAIMRLATGGKGKA